MDCRRDSVGFLILAAGGAGDGVLLDGVYDLFGLGCERVLLGGRQETLLFRGDVLAKALLKRRTGGAGDGPAQRNAPRGK